jgi:hypothetical protein
MKVTISAVLRGQIVVEVPEEMRAKIAGLDPPLDLDDFELHCGIAVDVDEFLNSGVIEIDDIDISAPKKSREGA